MPAIANYTVKKNDGTTDIVYTAVQASGGDKSPAVWRSNTVGTAAAHRPEFRSVSRSNGDATGRRVEFAFSYPSTVTGSDGKISVAQRLVANVSVLVPLGMPDTDTNEACSQLSNLLGATHTKDQLKAGFAST